MILYFAAAFFYLAETKGTYSYTFQTSSGSFATACGIPFFTKEDWLWTAFELFGVPLIILLAAVRTIQFLHRRLF